MPIKIIPARSMRGSQCASWCSVLLLVVVVSLATSCGLNSDGSRKSADTDSTVAASAAAQLGRFRVEAVRKGVTRPLFLMIDTATGMVAQRYILGSQRFRPVADEPAPGADLEPKIPGRYDVQVVPGRGGSALLRLDTVTGKTWMVQLSASQPRWYVVPGTSNFAPLDAKPKSSAEKRASTRDKSSAQSEAPSGTKKPPLDSLVEVLIEPGYQTELRVWTAGHMASVYPAEAAELLSTTLESAEPKVVIAVIEGLTLDPAGRVRTALESLVGHADSGVAKAARKKLNAAK